MISAEDRDAIESQLGRPIRGALEVAHRCACGKPDVVKTAPRLEDGTPFPTVYYLTCPKATSAIGTLEADGKMRELETLLSSDPELASRYQLAHEQYLEVRESLGHVEEISGISAGGMPNRVKCLHVLVAHSLASGPGVNPLGDLVLDDLAPWHVNGSCIEDVQ